MSMKKTIVILAISVFSIALLSMITTQAATWQGPPSGCTTPEQTNCNTDGVIWNRTSPVQNASFRISGNGIASGRIGAGGDIIQLTNAGNLWMQSGKTIDVDGGGSSILNINNNNSGVSYVNATLYGTFKTRPKSSEDSSISAPKYCFLNAAYSPTDCITSWPTGGISQTDADDRYVNVTGDSMSGQLSITNLSGWGLYGYGTYGVGGRGSGTAGRGVSGSITSNVTNGYAGYFDAQNASGISFGIYARGASGGAGARVVNSASTLAVELANTYGYAISASGPSTFNGDVSVSNGHDLCLNGDCRSSWPSGGSGDITAVTANAPLTGGGTSGAVSLGLQTCGNMQLLKYNTSFGEWQCFSDLQGSGDITGVTAGNGLTGGGTSGAVTLNIGGGTGLTVGSTYVELNTSYTDGRYVNASGNDSMTGQLNLRSSGVGGGSVALQVAGAEALWYDGSRFSWGYGGTENYFADDVYINDSSDAPSGGGLVVGNKSSGHMRIDTNEVMARSGGSSATLHLNAEGGIVYIGQNTGGSSDLRVNGAAYKPSGGSWGTLSDERLKTNVTPIENALEQIEKLQGVEFNWINPSEHGNKDREGGFIAQDVEKIFPNWITPYELSGKDSSLIPDQNAKAITLPFEFDALLVESIKELKAENDALKARLDDLEKRLEELETN